jgi:hypothetical protein
VTTEIPPEHRLLVERSKLAAETDSVEARAARWRGASDEERSRVFVGLFRMSVSAAQATGYEKPPLAFPRFSSRKPRG